MDNELIYTIPAFIRVEGYPEHGFVAGLTYVIFEPSYLFLAFVLGLYIKIYFRDNTWPMIFTFIAFLITGGMIGINFTIPFYRAQIIVTTLILFGTLLGIQRQLSKGFLLLLVGISGLTLGNVLGTKMPPITSPVQYVPGFASGALIVASAGEYIGRHMGAENMGMIRFAGGIIVGVGLSILWTLF